MISFERKWRGAALLLLAGLLLGGCGGKKAESEAEAPARPVAPPPSVRVAEGGPQIVRLDSAQLRELKIQTVRVAPKGLSYELSLPGTVEAAPENLSMVSAPLGGRVVTVYAHEGDAVRRGQVLADLESLTFANLAADYLQAIAEERYQQSQVDRQQQLVAKKISPQSALDKAQADLSRAQASVGASQARLRAVGVGDAQIRKWAGAQAERPVLHVYAPISGIISEHLIDRGQSVADYQHMMTILNLSQVLVKGFVSPDDAPQVHVGAPVRITEEKDSTHAVAARVASINPSVDPNNRSVTVNILAPTRAGWPIPGQTVRLGIRVQTPQPVLTVPLSAIQYEGDRATVFVRRDARSFEKRYVTIRKTTDRDVIVESGLTGGEQVATSQVFSLKALGRFEQFAEE